MERRPLSIPFTITVLNKTGSFTTVANSPINDAGGYLRQVIVKAPFDTATFNFRIENSQGHNVVKYTEQVGEIVDDRQTPLPAGIYTGYIENASHDGSYECELVYAEVY